MVPALLMIGTSVIAILIVLVLSVDSKIYKPYGKITCLTSLLFIFIAIITYAFLTYVLKSSNQNDIAENLERAVQFSGGAVTLGSLIGSIVIWRESNKYQMRQTIINQFEQFRADRYDKTRKKAWRVWLRWNEAEYKTKLLNAYFDKKDTNCIEENIKEVRALKKELRRVRDILEFYNGLLPYKSEAGTMIECKYLFYDWWRPFLYEFASKCDDHYKANDKLKNEQYTNNTSYISSLKSLDKLFGFEDIDRDFEFHPRRLKEEL